MATRGRGGGMKSKVMIREREERLGNPESELQEVVIMGFGGYPDKITRYQ